MYFRYENSEFVEVIQSLYSFDAEAEQDFVKKRLLIQSAYEKLQNPYSALENKNSCSDHIDVSAKIESHNGQKMYELILAINSQKEIFFCDSSDKFTFTKMGVFKNANQIVEIKYFSASYAEIKAFDPKLFYKFIIF